jgi:YebC/PmpR family DNA-binding regulatory protein
MSGHSKWSTIKHQKEVNDKAKGQKFSRLVKAITIAVKTGGGPDPDSNYKLRIAIDSARTANMPKTNIERAISSAEKSSEQMEEVMYEGFGPEGVGILVETATDNRNRTGQEIKNIFERGEGSMGGPGSVSFNFDQKGLLIIRKNNLSQDQILNLIDYGVEDMSEENGFIEAYVNPSDLQEISKKIENQGYTIEKTEFVRVPRNYQTLSSPEKAKKTLNLLETLDDQDDVQRVFTNADIPQTASIN